MKKYTDEEVRSALEKLDGWKLHKGAIEKNYGFKDFNEAFAFSSPERPYIRIR